jgi:hypothetical protein
MEATSVTELDGAAMTTDLVNLNNRTPDYIKCGAQKRGQPGEYCGAVAGQGTDHVGEGRCRLHGGARGSGRPIIHGRNSTKPRVTLVEQISYTMNDEALLDASREVALLRALVERQIAAQENLDATLYDAYLLQLEAWEQDSTGPMPSPPSQGGLMIDLDVVKTLVNAQRHAFEMKFSKRFSIPVEELGALLIQIGDAFNKFAAKYNLPNEAKVEFGAMMRGLSISKPMDAQLMRAGMDRSNSAGGQESQNRGQESANPNSGRKTIDI